MPIGCAALTTTRRTLGQFTAGGGAGTTAGGAGAGYFTYEGGIPTFHPYSSAPPPAPMPFPIDAVLIIDAKKAKDALSFYVAEHQKYPSISPQKLQQIWAMAHAPPPIKAVSKVGVVAARNRALYGTDVAGEIAKVIAFRKANPRFPRAMWPAIAPCPPGQFRRPNAALVDALASGYGSPATKPLPSLAQCAPVPVKPPSPALVSTLVQASEQDRAAPVTGAPQGAVSRFFEKVGAAFEGTKAAEETKGVLSEGAAPLATAEEETAKVLRASEAEVSSAVGKAKWIGAAVVGAVVLVGGAIVWKVVR